MISRTKSHINTNPYPSRDTGRRLYEVYPIHKFVRPPDAVRNVTNLTTLLILCPQDFSAGGHSSRAFELVVSC